MIVDSENMLREQQKLQGKHLLQIIKKVEETFLKILTERQLQQVTFLFKLHQVLLEPRMLLHKREQLLIQSELLLHRLFLLQQEHK
jgi:hypothetical protein